MADEPPPAVNRFGDLDRGGTRGPRTPAVSRPSGEPADTNYCLTCALSRTNTLVNRINRTVNFRKHAKYPSQARQLDRRASTSALTVAAVTKSVQYHWAPWLLRRWHWPA